MAKSDSQRFCTENECLSFLIWGKTEAVIICKRALWVLGFLSFTGLAHPIAGQSTLRDSLFESIKEAVEPMVSASLSSITYQPPAAYNFYVLDAVLNLRDESLERTNRDAINDLRIQQIERDWGLSLRSQVSHNFSDLNLVQDEIDEQVYPTRFRIGIDVDLTKDGFFAHQNQAKRLSNQKEMEWLEFDSKRNQERSFYRQNVLIYFFNKEKIKILTERISMLTKQLDLLYTTYYLRDILYEEVLDVKSKLEQAQVLYKNYQEYNAALESALDLHDLPAKIDVTKLPIVDIDVHRLLNDTLFDARTQRVLALEAANQELKDSWVNDISLRLQFNQNLALSFEERNDRFFPSVGMVATVPVELLLDNKINQELNSAERNYAEKFKQYEQLNAATEIINFSYEYHYKLKTYVEFLYKNLLYEEKLRIELLNRTRFTEYYQPFAMLRHYDNLNEIRVEMLDLKQQLYLILMRIYARTPLKSLRPYLYPVSLNQYFAKLAGSRTIFINKDDFNSYDRNFIDNYLRFNDFQYAILDEPVVYDLNEPEPQVNLPKGSEVHFIQSVLWRASMKYPEKAASDLISKLKKNGLSGFVLYLHEAELEGLGEIRTAELTRQITDFMVEVDRLEPSMPIFLSVPASFKLDHLNGLGIWVEKVIVRMQQEADLELLKNLPTELLPFERVPICISLDVNKFENRLKMEAFINQTVKKYPVDDIIFNNFKGFVAMDTKLFSE